MLVVAGTTVVGVITFVDIAVMHVSFKKTMPLFFYNAFTSSFSFKYIYWSKYETPKQSITASRCLPICQNF